MATKKWNAIDNYTNDPEEYFCAFLDILGYKEKSERFFQGKFNLHGRFSRALSVSIELFNLTSHIIDTKSLEVKFFSDSIIILMPEIRQNADQKFGFIQFCAILSAHLSFEDLLVRGGVSKGSHKQSIDPAGFSFMASIALQKAYILESTKAKNPRIVVDPELVIEFRKASAETSSYLAQEKDDCFIHFAPQLINKHGKNEDIVFKEMMDIQRTMNIEAEEKVKKKYAWLLDYYHWTLSNTPNIDISKFSHFCSGLERNFKSLPL